MQLKGSRKEGKAYLNLIPTEMGSFSNMHKMLWEHFTNKAVTTPIKPMGPFKTDASVYQTPPASGLRITWMGHSSLLIEIDGKRILTDPVWSKRVSFTQWMGPKRFFAPPIALKDLPSLDAILISHDHYDHLDTATIKFFADKGVPFFCSLGVGFYLQEWGISKRRITEMDWGDTAWIDNAIKLTTTPTRHFSGRGLHNRNGTLWSAFVIKGPQHNIFFGADSGWFEGFKDIGDAYGPFDLTMLEIGAYGKYWPDIHMGPDHASNAHLALKGKLMMPIHWATYNLAPHGWHEPIDRLLKYGQEKHIPLFIPAPGQPTEVDGKPYNSGWWLKSV